MTDIKNVAWESRGVSYQLAGSHWLYGLLPSDTEQSHTISAPYLRTYNHAIAYGKNFWIGVL